MMNFCTLYDSNYISKGIALYLSIEKFSNDFTMYVMAMDRETEDNLKKLNFPNLIVECLEDNSSVELEVARENRSRAEFNWTCSSYITHLFLTKYRLSDITYLDSDLMFFGSPKAIFDEFENKHASIGLSPHFIPYNATGKYCVQFCYFKNNIDGISALSWWKNECLKWCYSKIENGKYGDQMYLDKMPEMFNNVWDINHRGAGMAYWNEYAYKIKKEGLFYNNETYPFIFFHYSGFNIGYKNNIITVKECYPVKKATRNLLVIPYISLLSEVYNKYLGLKVNEVVYIKDYTIIKKSIIYLSHKLMKFIWFNRLKAFLLTRKYKKRNSPYSEK